MIALIRLLLLSNLFVLAACTEDIDFDRNDRTVDVRLDNAEMISLGVLQSTLLAHTYLPLFDFLDASELPDRVIAQGDGSYLLNCVVSGTVLYTASRAAGEQHQAGDRVQAEFDLCDNGNGTIYDGSYSASYRGVSGLNKHFVMIDTDSCLAAIQERISGLETLIEVSGDEVFFTRNGADMRVTVNNLVSASEGAAAVYELVEEYLVPKGVNAIVVNRRTNLPAAAVTSIDGDDLYSLVDNLAVTENCQAYERRLAMTYASLSIERGGMVLVIDGSVNVKQNSLDSKVLESAIDSSTYSVRVTQGRSENTYNLKGFTLAQTLDPETGVYSISLDGSISSSVFGGLLELQNDSQRQIIGRLQNDFPHSGLVRLLGQNDEQIALVFNGQNIAVQVDFDGDNNGDLRSDIDQVINTTWAELIARDFQQSSN